MGPRSHRIGLPSVVEYIGDGGVDDVFSQGSEIPSRIPSRALPSRSPQRRSIFVSEISWVCLLVAVVANLSRSQSTIGSRASPMRTLGYAGACLVGSWGSVPSLSKTDPDWPMFSALVAILEPLARADAHLSGCGGCGLRRLTHRRTYPASPCRHLRWPNRSRSSYAPPVATFGGLHLTGEEQRLILVLSQSLHHLVHARHEILHVH